MHSSRMLDRGVAAFGATLLGLTTIATDAFAQVTLPQKLDLVRVGSAPGVPADFVAVPAQQLYTTGALGWEYPSGLSGSWFALPTTPLSFDLTLEPTGLFPTYEAAVAGLVAQGHDVPSGSVFRVDTGPGTFLVRVSVGKPVTSDPAGPATDLRGVEIRNANDPSVPIMQESHPVDGGPTNQGLWIRTLRTKASLETALNGAARTLWFELDVESGEQLALEFLSNQAPTTAIPVNSIEVYTHAPAPVEFDRNGDQLVVTLDASDPDRTPLQRGVDALHAQDVDGAEALFRLASGELNEIAGLLWTAGWLAQDEVLVADSREWRLVTEAIARLEALVGSAAPGDAGTLALYLDATREFRRALMFHRWRGYTEAIAFDDMLSAASPFAAVTQSGWDVAKSGRILANMNMAEACYRNLSGQRLSDVRDIDARVIHPLTFKSFALLGVMWNARSQHNRVTDLDPVSPQFTNVHDFLEQAYDLWSEFAPWAVGGTVSAGLFSDSDILRVGVHLAEYDGTDAGLDPDYDQEVEGGIIKHYGGEGAAVVHLSSSTWWSTRLADSLAGVDLSGTTWATPFWSALRYKFASVDWWTQNRLVGSEAGGGEGDDVEFFGPLLDASLPSRGSNPAIETYLRERALETLAQYEDTYFYAEPNKTGDVEHTAEYTPYSALVGILAFLGEPYFVSYALKTMEHLDASTAAAQNYAHGGWTEVVSPMVSAASGGYTPATVHHYPGTTGPAIGMRAFRASHFDGDSILLGTVSNGKSTIGDVPCNLRAVLPAIRGARSYVHPTSAELLRELAEWWLFVAMEGVDDEGETKPVGALPGAARVVANADGAGSYAVVFGELNAGHWWEGMYGLKPAYQQYVYDGLFLERYLDPDTPATERADYLQPIFEMSKLIAEYWRVSQATPTGPVLYGTTAMDLAQVNVAGSDAWLAARLSLQADSLLRSVRNAYPYLAGDPLVTAGYTTLPELLTTLELLLRESAPASGPLLFGDVSTMASVAQIQTDYSEAFFPLGTNYVLYTDRIFWSPSGVSRSLLEASVGGGLGLGAGELFTLEDTLGRRILDAPAPKIAYMIDDVDWIDRDGLSVRAHQFETDPGDGSAGRTVVARSWFGLRAGTYQAQVVDSLGTVRSSATLVQRRPGGQATLVVPWAQASSGEEFTISLDRTGDLPNGEVADVFFDLALDPRSFEMTLDPVMSGGSQTGWNVSFECDVANLGPVAGTADVVFQATLDSGASFTPIHTEQAVAVQGVSGFETDSTTVTTSPFTVPAGWITSSDGLEVGILVSLNHAASSGSSVTDGLAENDLVYRLFVIPEVQ